MLAQPVLAKVISPTLARPAGLERVDGACVDIRKGLGTTANGADGSAVGARNRHFILPVIGRSCR